MMRTSLSCRVWGRHMAFALPQLTRITLSLRRYANLVIRSHQQNEGSPDSFYGGGELRRHAVLIYHVYIRWCIPVLVVCSFIADFLRFC